jgi:hypothetical protein
MPSFTYPTDFSGTLWRILDGDIYVSYNGHDVAGNGTPTSPYATIQYAIDAATADQKIVVGTGDYNENVNGADKDCFIIADGTVEMDGTDPGGAAFTNMGPSAVVSGFKILNYTASTDDPMLRFEDCFIEASNVTGAVTTLLRCVIKNCEISGAVTDFLNCTFINANKQAQTSGATVENCHFGDGCIFSFISSALVFFNNCNQEPGSTITIDSVNYSSYVTLNAAFPQFQSNGLSDNPSFNRTTRNDFTLRNGSTLVQAGTHSQPIGAFGLASSWDNINLGGVSMTNIIIDTDGYYTLPEETNEGSIETKALDLGLIRVLGRVDLFADQYFSPDFFGSVTYNQDTIKPPRPITFLMRYHVNDRDIFKTDYKEFIWDKIPTVDASGRGNGDPGFNPLSERPIRARFVQVRIVLRHTSDSFFITQEDGDLLLQEDGGKLKLENA